MKKVLAITVLAAAFAVQSAEGGGIKVEGLDLQG